MAQTQLKWTGVASSNVDAVAYDEGTDTLCVRFLHGGLYTYEDTGEDIYVGLVHAESVGQYLNDVIKAGGYTYTRFFSEQELLASIDARRG